MRRSLVAGGLLLALYFALSLLNDPRGYLGTDTGGKVATLEVMSAGDGFRFDPDVGYWAEQWDADGRVHSLYYTAHFGDAWVQLSTLPMSYAALPLYNAWGYRAALLLPMLGGVGAAAAAGALVHRLGGRRWLAFWAVGLASPITIYALDFWEHSLGVAFIGWAVVLLLDVVLRDAVDSWGSPARQLARAAGAGALFGLAATMRTEALVYAAASCAVFGVILMTRRSLRRRLLTTGVVFVAPFAAVLLANEALERATWDRSLRGPRARGTAALAGDAPWERAKEALYTVVASEASVRGVVVGAVIAVLVVFAWWRARDEPSVGLVAIGGAGLLLAIRFAWGLGFVPGLLVAWTMAGAAAIVVTKPTRQRALFVIAVIAVPVVLLTQFRGGAAPQWGGRYLLPSGFLLTVVALTALHELHVRVRILLLGLAAAVTVFGLSWLSMRSHDVGRTVQAINRRPEPVVVSTVAHLSREGGAFYGDKRWLTAPAEELVEEAARVVERAGETRFVLVELEDDEVLHRSISGWRKTDSDRLRFIRGVRLRLTSWQRVTR